MTGDCHDLEYVARNGSAQVSHDKEQIHLYDLTYNDDWIDVKITEHVISCTFNPLKGDIKPDEYRIEIANDGFPWPGSPIKKKDEGESYPQPTGYIFIIPISESD